jgi:tRNA A-37 threonylcarbamoyl transferase component Bud32
LSAGLRWLAGDASLREELALLLASDAGAENVLLLREQPGRRRLLRARLASGERLFLKVFAGAPRRHRLREAAKRTLGLGGARREWRSLVALHARGVAVPEPRALAALPGGGFVIATRFLEGRTLAQTLASPAPGRRALLHAVGDLVASLHAAGFAHRDLHHGNILVGPDGVFLLDVQAALPLRTAAARLRDLGELDHSLAGALSLADRVRVRARALRFARPFRAGERAQLRAAGEASQARARAHARSRTRRARRPGRRYAQLRDGARAGLRLRRIEEAMLLEALRAHELALAGQGSQVLQQRARSSVTRCEVAGLAVVAKEWRARGWLRALADRLRGSPAARAWRSGVGLRARRIGSAVPYAYLEQRRLGLPVASWLLLEDLRPALPADAAAAQLDGARVADALASLLARLHRAGIRHGDLKGSHVFLAPRGGGLEARLIDLEDVRFSRRVSERARIRELAQLNASLPDALDDTLRCRAFARYRAAVPFRADAGECLRRVVAESLARQHRWSGRGCKLAAEIAP